MATGFAVLDVQEYTLTVEFGRGRRGLRIAGDCFLGMSL